MYIANEKEKHLQDINATLREVDHLDIWLKWKKRKMIKARLIPMLCYNFRGL